MIILFHYFIISLFHYFVTAFQVEYAHQTIIPIETLEPNTPPQSEATENPNKATKTGMLHFNIFFTFFSLC